MNRMPIPGSAPSVLDQTTSPSSSNGASRRGTESLNRNRVPTGSGFYHYSGSLTTPPCSEDVRWQVMKQPVEVSRSQIAAFRKLYSMNARPVQPLNDRKVEEN